MDISGSSQRWAQPMISAIKKLNKLLFLIYYEILILFCDWQQKAFEFVGRQTTAMRMRKALTQDWEVDDDDEEKEEQE